MYHEVEIDVPGEEFLVTLLVWVEAGEDAETKIRAAVAQKFPDSPVEEFELGEFA